MTMRSIPPASSHLADRPVPAPPPTIGSPRAAMSVNLVSSSCRSVRGTSTPCCACAVVRGGRARTAGAGDGAGDVGDVGDVGEGRDEFLGELRVVDVVGRAY